MSSNIVIAGSKQQGFEYLYDKVIGDGHCFINCYLKTLSKTYNNAKTINEKTAIARKCRLDFAKHLLTKSNKTDEYISIRLNMKNPTVMGYFIRDSNDNNGYEILETYFSLYGEIDLDEIFRLIIMSEMTDRNGDIVTTRYLNELLKTDPRVNNANFDGSDPKILGFGIIPININFYELTNTLPSDYNYIINIIDNLISPSAFLEHESSALFASFFGINVTVFNMGSELNGIEYSKPSQTLIDYMPDKPELFLINLSNIHWNMVSCKMGNKNHLIFMGVPDTSKLTIFNNLKKLYNSNSLAY